MVDENEPIVIVQVPTVFTASMAQKIPAPSLKR